jgi:hypothetical protein
MKTPQDLLTKAYAAFNARDIDAILIEGLKSSLQTNLIVSVRSDMI